MMHRATFKNTKVSGTTIHTDANNSCTDTKVSFRSPSGDDIIIDVDKRNIRGIAVHFATNDRVAFSECGSKVNIQEQVSSSLFRETFDSQPERLIPRCISWDCDKCNMQHEEQKTPSLSNLDNNANYHLFLPALDSPKDRSIAASMQGSSNDRFVEDDNLRYDYDEDSSDEMRVKNEDSFLADIQHLIVKSEALAQEKVTTKEHNAFLLEKNEKLAEQLRYLQELLLPRHDESLLNEINDVETKGEEDNSSTVTICGEEARTRQMLTTMVKRFLVVVHERNQLKMQIKDLLVADLEQTKKHAKDSSSWEEERQEMKRQLRQQEEYIEWLMEHQSAPKNRRDSLPEDAANVSMEQETSTVSIPEASPVVDSNDGSRDTIAVTPLSSEEICSPPVCQRTCDVHACDPSSLALSEGSTINTLNTTKSDVRPLNLFKSDDESNKPNAATLPATTEVSNKTAAIGKRSSTNVNALSLNLSQYAGAINTRSSISRQATMQTSNVSSSAENISSTCKNNGETKRIAYPSGGEGSRLVVRWDKGKSPFRGRNNTSLARGKGSPSTEASLTSSEASTLHESWDSFPLTTWKKDDEHDHDPLEKQSPYVPTDGGGKVESTNNNLRHIASARIGEGPYTRNKPSLTYPATRKQTAAPKSLNASLSSGCSTSSKKNKNKNDVSKRFSRTPHLGHPELQITSYQPLHDEEPVASKSSKLEHSITTGTSTTTSEDALQVTARGGERELAARKELEKLLLQAYLV